MLFRDSLSFCLLALLVLLLCGERDIRLFVSGLWRSVPLDGWRRGGCHMAGVLLAGLALVGPLLAGASPAGRALSATFSGGVSQAGASACLSVAALVLLGGGEVFCPFWGVPALLAYALLPAGMGCLGLMAVCLWAAGRTEGGLEGGAAARFVALVLLLGLGQEMADHASFGWILGSMGLTASCLLLGRWADRLSLLRYCQLLRPLLLLGVMEMSRQQGLTAGEEAAFFALLLDMTCQCLGVIWPGGRLLALVVPPLPGFVIGWAGLHAALGLGSNTEGWTVLGCLLAVGIMGLSLGEGLVILGQASALGGYSRRFRLLGLLLAAGLPPVCGMVAGWLCGQGRGWVSWLYGLPGGDGTVLALPLFWLALLALWAVLGRAGRAGEGDEEAMVMGREELPAPEDGPDGLEGLRLFLHHAPLRPRMMRWLLLRGQKQTRSLHLAGAEILSFLPVRGVSMMFWLVFLGGVMVVLGLAQ